MRLIATFAVAASALTLAACEPADTQTPPAQTEPAAEAPASVADPNALTPAGWNGLTIGMTRAEVVAAMGEDSNPNDVGGAEPEYCDQFRPLQAPEGLLVMLNQGMLSRISITEPSTLLTDHRFGIGASAADIKAAYGDQAIVTPHRYVEAPAEDIIIWDGARPADDEYIQDPARRGVRYEIGGDGRVSAIHVGGPDIQLVEGCS